MTEHDERALEAEVLATVQALLNAWAQQGPEATDAFLAHVAEDFTGFGTGSGEFMPDRDALRAMSQNEREQMVYPVTTEVLWMNARLWAPTVAHVEGEVRTAVHTDDATLVMQPRYSILLDRRDGQWLLSHFHFSVPDAMQEEGGTLVDTLEGRNRELEKQVAERTVELEASRREAEVEVALERVRSRTMAMQSSDDLRKVVATVYEQFRQLGIDAPVCMLATRDDGRAGYTVWVSNLVQTLAPESYHVPPLDHPVYRRIMAAWDDGTPYLVTELDGADKQSFGRVVFEETEMRRLAEPVKAAMLSIDRVVLSAAFTPHSFLEASGPSALPAGDALILQRFARVFDQAYTRFLDLQSAEAQAREAQIEAALERVRSRAMAMRSSDELREMVLVILKEMKALAFPSGRCTIVLFDRETGDGQFWMSGLTDADLPERYHVPYHELPTYKALHDGWRQGIPFFEIELAGEVKREQDRFFHEETEFSRLPEPAKEGMRSMGDLWLSNASTTHGVVQAVGPEPLSAAAAAILRRFAKVIDLTYTRVEDIQQSEAQVREAHIEAAMERVRSRALAMTTSDELLDVIVKIHQEFSGLGLLGEVFWQTRYTPESYHKAVTSAGGKKVSAIMELPRDFSMVPELAAWEHGDEKIGVFQFDADAAASYVHHMNTKGHFHKVDPEGITPEIARELGGLTFVQARTSHGEIGYALWGETEPSEEAKDVLVRFTSAFDLAYRRFEDLQQAEADHQALLEEKAVTEQTLAELRAMQAQLIQSEKMASLGQLTAGIAHEIKNPLNFVNNFAGLSQELVAELEEETNPEERQALLSDLMANAAKIEEHGRRADAIVRAMMEHARSGSGQRRPVALNALVEEYAAHALHAMKVRQPDFAATLDLDLAADAGEVEIEPQEIGRVLINLIDNALDATRQRAAEAPEDYTPTVTVSTRRTDDGVQVRVADNGTGMAEAVRAKVFEPFFTTKPTGQGTGLGLSMSYDIVTQGHRGALTVESEEGAGATFVLALPARQTQASSTA